MKAYEQGSGAYFATPPVNLICALNASLTTITKSSEVSLEERFRRHEEASKRVKSAAKEFGLSQVPDQENAANGMTAVSFILAYFLRGFRLTFVRVALLPRGVYRFGHSSAALCEGCCCRRGIAQGHQGPVLSNRVSHSLSSFQSFAYSRFPPQTYGAFRCPAVAR